MKPGTQIVYIADHKSDLFERSGIINFRRGDMEPGFVVSESKVEGAVFCRYWRITHTIEVLEYDLRTKANSELTFVRNLIAKDTVLQEIVTSIMAELGYVDLTTPVDLEDEMSEQTPNEQEMLQMAHEKIAELEAENSWMRREVERVGHAIFTGDDGYVGTEEDLHAIGQSVEGICETLERTPMLEAVVSYAVHDEACAIEGKGRDKIDAEFCTCGFITALVDLEN